jgi:aspartyl-tRNA(Asn)/glutamyl-tRNA(Gln) amidotransferase subunit C
MVTYEASSDQAIRLSFPWFFPKILPMPLAIEDVARIAHLARIHISDEEAERTLAQLNDIFAMIEQMRAVDTTGVEPMAHPLGGSQRLRDDVATEPDWREAAMRNAPAHEDGLFLVPKVIE